MQSQSGYVQITSAASGSTPETLSLEADILKEGYLYIYVANESNTNTDVYFDDLEITLTESTVKSRTDFYPFGLPIDGLSYEIILSMIMRNLPIFDYIFYRIYGFFKEKGDNVPDTKGSLLLSLIQFLTIIDIMIFVKIIYDYPFPTKYYFLPVLVLLGIINWYRYERDFDIIKLDAKWKDEDPSKKVRNGWLIGLYLIVSFLIPAIYGYLHVNLKVM